MDRQYEYLFIDPTDRHGFLSHDTSQWIDPLAQEGMNELKAGLRWRKAKGGLSSKKRVSGNQRIRPDTLIL
jgi:hypothetical protein